MSANLANDKTSSGEHSVSMMERAAKRTTELLTTDVQLRAAMPLEAVNKAKSDPKLSLAEVISLVMVAYADRPAIAERAGGIEKEAGTGRSIRMLLPEFRTITYRELWHRVRAIAAAWQDPVIRVNSGDLVAILAFGGKDYVTVDLAVMYLGGVTVPLPATATTDQLTQMVREVEPRCLATSIQCLSAAVDVILVAYQPASLLVFNYHSDDDGETAIFNAARARLEAANCPLVIDTIDSLCDRGAGMPPVRAFSDPASALRLSNLYYTSGSTGSPKGAMYPEQMAKQPWLSVSLTPVISLLYMPLNHSFGRAMISTILANGGTCYFAAKDDLSTLFDDIRLVQPSHIALVPRICEMIHHQYEAEVERRGFDGASEQTLDPAILALIRRNYLGDRMLSAVFGAAPMTPELTAFIQACLDVKLNNGYGTTETSVITLNNRIMRPPVIDFKLIDVPELGYYRTDKPNPRGELAVKTHSLMLGYFKRPELTAAMFDEDGYYKTGDIMAEVGPDQIVYLDRRNNILKLAQGEFVAIARLEALFNTGHPLIRQIYIYGSSEWSFLLAVVVPHLAAAAPAQPTSETTQLKPLLQAAITEIARLEGLQAYEVPRDFLVDTEPFTAENGLLTGVGKYARPALKAHYGPRLEQLHADITAGQASELRALRRESGTAPVLDTVTRAVRAILGIEDLDLDQPRSFTELGGDSLAALSFSLLLEEMYDIEVPVGIITDPTGSLPRLAQYIVKARSGTDQRPSFTSVHGRGVSEVHAKDLSLEKFIDAATLQKAHGLPCVSSDLKTILITGANGYLGRFLCLEWLERMKKVGGRVVCIARGKDSQDARRRIAAVFDSGDAQLLNRFHELAQNHLEVLAGDLSEPNLGLRNEEWTLLAQTVDLICHPAAHVNHVLPYQQLFGANVVGTAELIRLAITTRLKRFDNVSTVAAAFSAGGILDEDADIRSASPTRAINDQGYASGYATSKWAGEVLLREAHEQLGLPVAVFRSDMILAHSRFAGQINVPDMFTRWLFSVVVTGLAPRSFYVTGTDGGRARAHYDGLPVDFTAEAITAIGANHTAGYRTYHVLNPHEDDISLDQFVDWAIAAGHTIRRIDDYDDWLARFETALRALPDKQRQQSSLVLLHQMRRPAPISGGALVPAPRFRSRVRELGIGTRGDIPQLSEAFLAKNLRDLRQVGLLG